MAEDVKIVLTGSSDDKTVKETSAGARALSLSMKDGGLSRIPRFSRRVSAADALQSHDPLNESRDSSSLNKSFDSSIRNLVKRHHSIQERGERDIEESESESNNTTTPIQHVPTGIMKTPSTQRKGLNPLAVKRNKSFSAGERPNINRYNMKSLRTPTSPKPLALSSSPVPSEFSLQRRKSFYMMEIAQKEGIISAKATKKTASVHDPGRVQVFVRIRPPNETEDLNRYAVAVSVEDQESTQLKLFDGKNDRCYQFDGILPYSSTNKEVYKTVGEPLVYSALSGFNGILMCYGQTGTGKTYTLMSNDGISVRVVYQLFKVVNSDKRHRYTVACSYLQIYQEKIFDLLNETRTVELSLREHPKTGVYIENLTEYIVHSPKEVLNLLKVGKRRLVFAETKMNRVSSRSHAICQLRILKERIGVDSSGSHTGSPSFGIKTPDDLDDEYDYYDDELGQNLNWSSYQPLIDDEDDGDILSNVNDLEDGVTSVRGKIYICDLAGSERIKKTKASGERLQEAQHINSSLLELGNVIQALAEGNRSHVPFRNSTLTRLLQEGLSGNCKTRLVVCVAPTVKDVHESKCSLNFGSRAMKVQVMAHVNYEVDYKKLAEALAAKIEALESEWNIQKQDYEKFIVQLKSEIGNRKLMSPMTTDITGSNNTPKQLQSLLIVELMTLQLFYNLQGHPQQQDNSQILFTVGSGDLMLQSMEGLLELLGDYMRGRVPMSSKHSNQSSSNSSAITSPDYIEQSGSSSYDIPSTLEPVARFLEHAQITSANPSTYGNKKTNATNQKVSEERLKRVMNTLYEIKDTVNRKAVTHLKETFEKTIQESGETLMPLKRLDNIVAMLDNQKGVLSDFEALDDVQALERSLYYLVMDKALLSCLVLLKSQGGDLLDGLKSGMMSMDHSDLEIKRVVEELTTERNASDKLQEEIYTCREGQVITEEKLKDVELELRTVRELKDSLEYKLHAVENKNNALEEQIDKLKTERHNVECRLNEIDKYRAQLETNLKSSDNNNARKERLIVDLKNEKVALDSLVSTLKEEISILEKEKSRDTDERKQIEEELEDVRDRNIILETEWSCCREENGLLENELTALEEDKSILEDELLKYRDDVKMLEEAVAVLEAQAADYKQEILSLKTKEDRLLANIRTEKEKFNKEINTLRQEMSTLRVEKRRFQRDISVSKADKSNTERAYNALKIQKDSLQSDVVVYKQDEKRLQREISALKNDRAKLEREVNNLKAENTKLKQDVVHADKLKVELKLLQKNEDKISVIFNTEKNKLIDNLLTFKDKFTRMEQDFTKVCTEKDKLTKQLRRFEQTVIDNHKEAATMRRAQSQPTSSGKSATPDKGKLKPSSSVQGALVRRSVHSGEVSEVEGKVLDLQRRLAFFMAEKEDIQKELITTRERNCNLTTELKFLEGDTSKIQALLSGLADEKESLENRLLKSSESKTLLENERDKLKEAVQSAHDVTSKLQVQLDEVTEQNRILEVDQLTVKESVNTLQNETVVLKTENRHIKLEFEKIDNQLKSTREVVQNLNKKLKVLQLKVKDAAENENQLKDKVSMLKDENLSLNEQVDACQVEEEALLQQLLDLNIKFSELESDMEKLLIERSASLNPSNEVLQQVQDLKETNTLLEQTISDLKIRLNSVVTAAESLKLQREEIEKSLRGEELATAMYGEESDEGWLLESICHLKSQVSEVKQEKKEVEEKMRALELQLASVDHQNVTLQQHVNEKSNRLEQEKAIYKQHIDKLQQQIGALVEEKIQLEAEVEFLKGQNAELCKEIAIILQDNDKLEIELDQLEDEFVKQEKELVTATEETKSLLRQLCVVETQNLNLCTLQSNQQDDVESFKKQVETLKLQNEKIGEEKINKEIQSKTLQERLLMADLEISQLRSEHASVESQKRLLLEDLDAADQERAVLKSELQSLARALSPLKKEVTEVIKKQESLQNELNRESESSVDISSELQRVKEDLHAFNAEKAALEGEQDEIEHRLKILGKEKEELGQQLRHLIQDLDERNELASKQNLTGMEESIRMVSELLAKEDSLQQDQLILTDDLENALYTNQLLNVCVDNTNDELRSVQEDLCLATVDRLKLKDQTRQIDRSIALIQDGSSCNRSHGVTPLQQEVYKLKNDIESFEKSQENLLVEVRSLNGQLDVAENNLINVVHFKKIIEKHLRQYKERNYKLEMHLRVIYNDLMDMESHMKKAPSKGAKILLETLDLHKLFQTLEDDLRDTEAQHTTMKEDAADLLERCTALEEEKQLNTVGSGYLQDSMDGQHTYISMLQKEKQTLIYEKTRLQTKLSLFKDDKKRILQDFQRLNKSLGAYARYNHELEKKLEAFKVDFSDLESKADFVHHEKQRRFVNALTQPSNGHSSNLLCSDCRENVQRKFMGINKNTQLLGDELLDCISDTMSLETAIFSFMEQKSNLEQELIAMETDQCDLENILLNTHRNSGPRWSGSQSSVDSDFTKRIWSCGRLSTRSKSMTSHSEESFYGDEDLRVTTSSRSHTALGIYTSQSPKLENKNVTSPLVSPGVVRAATTSPKASHRILLSPSIDPTRKISNDEAYESQEGVNITADENFNVMKFETLHEEQHDKEQHMKTRHLSDFLKRLKSVKRSKKPNKHTDE